jgi:hypothetical protein
VAQPERMMHTPPHNGRLGQSYQPRRDDDFDALEGGVIVGPIFLTLGPLRALDAGTRESAEAVDGPRRVLMCGRLRVGKENLHVALLVGAAMCSACWCGSHDRVPRFNSWRSLQYLAHVPPPLSPH